MRDWLQLECCSTVAESFPFMQVMGSNLFDPLSDGLCEPFLQAALVELGLDAEQQLHLLNSFGCG